MAERQMYSEAKLDFITAPEVIARLTYNSAGEPIVLCGGKVRDRTRDLAMIRDWCRAMFLRTEGAERPAAVHEEPKR